MIAATTVYERKDSNVSNQRMQGTSPQVKAGLLTEVVRSARLVWRLLKDPRVATATKLLIPGLVGAYLLWPVDLLPDVIPLVGQVDDLVLLALGAKLFIELCPPEIVRQHQADLAGGARRDAAGGEVVDGDYRVIE
ncbi:MAG: hypothetical protein CVU38_13185 [Chloroflexi bacterium HGW-Chloroflexi-1]|nr:MAG: hypothetical protein CVU38_13185 [Chloroflexi bacterium HGW-Chloroflexi-1]